MKTKKPATSDFLFARPSTLSGVARLFDFAGTFDAYNTSATTDEADAKALHADWVAVGDDIESSMAKMESETDIEEAA